MDTTPEPPVRPPLALAADEITTLVQFLDFFRAELHGRAWGLTDADRSHRIAASDLTLAGLVKHMASVEHTWFVCRFRGLEPREPWASAPWDDDEDWEFHTADNDSASTLFALYTEACNESRTITAEADSLDQLSVRPNGKGDHWSLRWILVHMIEEYARHCGHADLIRESIDGIAG